MSDLEKSIGVEVRCRRNRWVGGKWRRSRWKRYRRSLHCLITQGQMLLLSLSSSPGWNVMLFSNGSFSSKSPSSPTLSVCLFQKKCGEFSGLQDLLNTHLNFEYDQSFEAYLLVWFFYSGKLTQCLISVQCRIG